MRYLPPGRIDDFACSTQTDDLLEAWHVRVKKQIDKYRNFERFLDPLDADDTAVREAIPWSGFPRIFDAWLSIDEDPDPIERGKRMDRAHRSAEIINRNIYVKLQSDGEFYRIPADPISGLMLYPEINGSRSVQDAFSLAYRPQDEYLEWFVTRDPSTNRIIRIDFTSEAPEYWETLSEGDNKLAATLYSELLGVNVPEKDLFFQGDVLCPLVEVVNNAIRVLDYTRLFPNDPDFMAGAYNPKNKWNTELGAIHLTQPANTLFAEINLAARATQRFAVRPDFNANVDRFSLIACGGYGGLNRNSDPTIGQSVNTLALSGFDVMVSNPIGLYIGEIDVSGFRDPSGNQVARDDILTVSRGKFNDEDGLARVLRFSIHPPVNADYDLDSCTFDGHPLTTGGPVARKTTIVIHGIAKSTNSAHSITDCEAEVCRHASKDPQYFLATKPGNQCPSSNDRKWKDMPVTLAPEQPQMITISGSPRSTGERSV